LLTKKQNNRIITFLLIIAFIVLISVPVLADTNGDFNTNLNILEEGQTVDGLGSFFANLVYVNGTVNGTTFTAGREVQINGTINGDLFVMAQTVTINGTINGNIYAAGQEVKITSNATGDVFLAGESLTIAQESAIGRDLCAAGRQIFLSGNVERQFFGAARNITISGKIGRDAQIATETLILAPEAIITGDLNYKSSNQATIASGATIGGKTDWTYIPPTKERKDKSIAWVIFSLLLKVAAAMIVWFILLKLWPALWSGLGQTVQKHPFKSIGVGVLVFLLTPIAFVLLMITVVGIPLGFIAIFTYGTFLYLAKIMVAVWGSTLLAKKFNWAKKHKGVWSVALCLLALQLLFKIPILCVVVWLAVAFIGLGAPILSKRANRQKLDE